MKKYIYYLVFALSLLALMGCGTQYSTSPTDDDTDGSGRTVFTMTDAAADMGSVSSIKITIDSVRVHSAAEGWVTVSNEDKTYDLLQLKATGNQALLADVQLEEGTYDQVRLDISSVVVTDAQGNHEAKLPSGELKIMGNLDVNANSTSTASFDFIADESLHVTGEGKYILAPVVQYETKENAEVEVASFNNVRIEGGRTKTNIKVGMNANGQVGVGMGIPANVNISISGGRVRVSSNVNVGIGNRDGNSDTDASADVDVDTGISY